MRSAGRRGGALLASLVAASVVMACRSPEAAAPELYFGQAPPGDTPVVFAPGVLSRDGRFEQALLYLPDGRTLTFGVTNAEWSAFTLFTMTLDDGGWGEPEPAPFLGDDPGALTACVSYDGSTAFFSEARPTYPPSDLWTSRRTTTGWSEPARLGPPVSSEADEFEVVVARNGTLYFSSSRDGGLGDLDIYRAPLVEGGYPAVENLGPPVNTSSGDDLPWIAPDESYLLFASDRPGGLGNRDLYISFRTGGSWTAPMNLGRPINSEGWDIYPSVSPDGRYLFFTRRDAYQATEDSDLYWVGTGFIERFREAVR